MAPPSLLLLLAQGSLAAPVLPPAPPPAPLERDAWSPPITWRASGGRFATGIHAVLLPDGRLLFIGYARPVKAPLWSGPTDRLVWTQVPPPIGQPPPAEVQVDGMDVPLEAMGLVVENTAVDDDLYCCGQTLLADGRLFTAGGTRILRNLTTGEVQQTGFDYAMEFDGAAWTRVPAKMIGTATAPSALRWYPTCTRLADGRVLVAGGMDYVKPNKLANLSVEAFDPATGGWTLLSPHGASPTEFWNRDYTHAFVLPTPLGGNELLMFGEAGLPVLFSLAGSWSVVPSPRPGDPLEDPNHGASTALLPLRVPDGEWGYANGSTLTAGGHHGTSYLQSADVYDPVADAWTSRDLGAPRHHPATVLLPDGRVLVVTGHEHEGGAPTRRAVYVDPARDFEVRAGSGDPGVVRGYHAVAVLLPDGRVLVGGGRGNTSFNSVEKTHFQLYSPGYLFRPRPAIVSAPDQMTYGASYAVTTAPGPAAEVVLIGLGAMTHSFDMGQRLVELERVGASGGAVTVKAPPDASTAPPGHYMLFALDARRTPSEARIVLVQ